MYKKFACMVKALVVVSVLFSIAAVRADEPPQHRFRGPRRQYAQVSNVSIAQDDSPGVEFDITWDHAWRDDESHDAAWVFFKARDPESGLWQHVRLAGSGLNPEGYSTGNGTDIELIVPDDGMGAFVRRAEEGSGTVDASDLRVLWDAETNAVGPGEEPELRGFAIEMVYVPEGAFYLGWAEEGEEVEGQNIRPLRIESEDAVTVGGKELHPNFPKGYGAFYCMKFELTKGQWVDFFNTLTAEQQHERDTMGMHPRYWGPRQSITDPRAHRAGILYENPGEIQVVDLYAQEVIQPRPGQFLPDHGRRVRRLKLRVFFERGTVRQTTEIPHVAANWIAWADGAAYTDWAGLRPVTQPEFEKAARGPLYPVDGEFAWGTDKVFGVERDGVASSQRTYDGVDYDTIDERLVPNEERHPDEGNAIWGRTVRHGSTNAITGPHRVGIFADEDADRVAAGASYWGIFNMNDHVNMPYIRINRPAGRDFHGLHGDGELTPDGYSNVPTWPDRGADGVGRFGGEFRHGIGSIIRRHTEGDAGPVGFSAGSMRGMWKNVGVNGWRAARTAPPEAAYD